MAGFLRMCDGSILPNSRLTALIADLLPCRPDFQAALRDMVSRPAFAVLLRSESEAKRQITRAALLEDLSETYVTRITEGLSHFIDGLTGDLSLFASSVDNLFNDKGQRVSQSGKKLIRGSHAKAPRSKSNSNVSDSIADSWWLVHLESLRERGARNYGP
jgi:hypothetical protein